MARPEEWPLWPGEAPGAPRDPAPEREIDAAENDPGVFTSVRRPSLFVYESAAPNGAAFVLAPGGSMARVAIGAGTGDIARRLNAAGASVFVLKYRLPSGRWSAGPDACLQDAQRAMRLVRRNAARFSIDPARVGVIGFSAGGFVAASVAARWEASVYEAIDDADAESAAPNLAGLIFPVIALDRPYAHAASRTALIGANADVAVGARYSPDLHMTARTPPTFVAHAADDAVVPSQNSVAMFEALHAAGVPAQLHLFERGGHGVAMGGGLDAPTSWLALFQRWAAERGFLRA